MKDLTVYDGLDVIVLHSEVRSCYDLLNTDLGVERGVHEGTAFHSPTLPLVTPANTDVTWHSSPHLRKNLASSWSVRYHYPSQWCTTSPLILTLDDP